MMKFNHLLLLAFLVVISSCKKELLVKTPKDYQTTGSAAKDFLTANTYTSLIIEISYMPGYAPDPNAVEELKTFLNSYTNKPVGITVITKQIPTNSAALMTINDITALEKNVRSVFSDGNTLTAHVLIVDAEYDKEKILGISYYNTSMCIFGKTVYKNSGGVGQVSRLQLLSSLLKHEFGHLLGLVNQGTPMVTDHADVANAGHCNNRNCLMYYQISTGVLGGTGNLDANCAADLKANGGK